MIEKSQVYVLNVGAVMKRNNLKEHRTNIPNRLKNFDD
jgi:hypothetical protein